LFIGTLDKRVEAQLGDETEVYAHTLDMAPLFHPQHHPREILNLEERPSNDDKKCPLEAELKPLPSYLRYTFHGPNKTFSIIINASLDGTQIAKLLSVLPNIEVP